MASQHPPVVGAAGHMLTAGCDRPIASELIEIDTMEAAVGVRGESPTDESHAGRVDEVTLSVTLNDAGFTVDHRSPPRSR